MTRARLVAVALACAAVAGYTLFWPSARVVVEPGTSLQATLDEVGAGTVVVLAPGTHRGPVTLSTQVHLQGESGAALVAGPSADAAVLVAASGSRVTGLRVEGGETGILVREVTGVEIDSVDVSGAELHGIEVVDGSARITSSAVDGLRHPMAQGIEIRNSDGRPDSVIEGVTVSGGQEGIVSHVSEVVVRDNAISNTTMRGIAITEMSDGFVSGNRISAAAGSGLFCGDMSRCAFDNNVAMDVAAGTGGRSSAGWGLVVTYHSSAWSSGNELGGDAGALMTSMGSHMRARSPLDPASPSKLVAPVALSALIALIVGGLGYGAASLWVKRRPAGRGRRPMTAGLLLVFLAVLGVQSFHMVEHWLQVYRVHVDLIPSRGGLIGPAVTSEWVHLAYNGALVLLLALTFNEVRRSSMGGSARWLGAALLVQGWHSIEHVAKITQHLMTGYPANPGLLGSFTDLVWFHFTINLTVYGLCVAAAILWLGHVQPLKRTVAEPVPV